MGKLRFTVFFILALSVSSLSAEIYGKMIGGDPFASWEDGGQDFFVMFNSNIDDLITMVDDDPENPQGDTCMAESTFTLTDFHVPEDAIIEKAYLVWMGAVDPGKLDQPTDNSVKLKFTQSTESPVTYEQVITVGETGKLLSEGDDDAEKTFDFESITFTDDVTIGCSESSMGSKLDDQSLGYFTYRADITDFFTKIFEENAKAAKSEEKVFFGDYTFSDLECTESDHYRCKTTMVSAWAVFFVYRSKVIRPKKIYIYNGLALVQGDKSVAEVSGFELPKFPVVRLATMVAEGDPKLVESDLPPEEISLQGEGASSKFRLYNDCNPRVSTYVEVFNSISSVVNWNPEALEEDRIKCVSGIDGTGLNFGIDVDTFYLDSETNVNLQEHLKKGNTAMDISLSVNQDAIFTNFMVLSVDNKGSNFDIPPEASDTTKSDLNFPLDREKHFCACSSNDDGKEPDYYCETVNNPREFYYFIKVQNWGDEDADDVVVTDELDNQLEYIAGTTEMATQYDSETDTYVDWTVIPDKNGGVFPLSGTGFKVSAKMVNCDEGNWSCLDTVLIRYKVKPKKGTSKNYVFNNMATIKDKKSDEAYKTNLSYPLKLKPTKCESDTLCPSPTQEMCGGTNKPKQCGEGIGVCPEGYMCQDFTCVDDPAKTCFNSTADFAVGKNSPQSGGTEIIVSKNNDGESLIVGQFTVMVNNCTEDKYFNIDSVVVHFETDNDKKFVFKDLELIHDANGNGVADTDDQIVASDQVINNYVKFFMNNQKPFEDRKKYPGKTLNYFLIRTKLDYNSEEIPRNTTFNFYIESETSISISDQGTTVVSPGDVEFAKFMLEPTDDFFIVTTGLKDASVPPITEMNNDIPVLQLRTKAIKRANSITKFTVKVPVSGGYVKFGEKNGIEGISLWIDSDKDGKGNVKVAEMTSFNVATSSVIFENFLQPLSYLEGEEKHLVINLDFDMVKKSDGSVMAGRIEISNGGVTLSDKGATVIELPVKSKEFAYECKDGDICPEPDPEPDPCKCTVVSVSDPEKSAALFGVFILLLVMIRGILVFRKNS